MKKLLALRPLNLGIIAATMICMRYCIVIPLLHSLSKAMDKEFTVLLTTGQFTLVVLSLVLIAAGGYIINDLNDKEEDEANGVVRESFGMSVYYALSGIGLALGVYVGYEVATYNLALIHVALVISLWFYANYLKGSVILGNIIVGFCTAMAPLTVGVYEVIPLQLGYPEVMEEFPNFSFNFIAYWTIGFAVFAFLFTLAREAMKDAQDVHGDSLAGKGTLAVAYGETAVKAWVTVVHLLTVYALWHAYLNYISDKLTLITAGILSLTFAYQTLAVWLANSPKDWALQSALNKGFSLIGLAYAFGVAYMLFNGVIL